MFSHTSRLSWAGERLSGVVIIVNRYSVVCGLVYMADMTIHTLLCEHLPAELTGIVIDYVIPSKAYWQKQMNVSLNLLGKMVFHKSWYWRIARSYALRRCGKSQLGFVKHFVTRKNAIERSKRKTRSRFP